jgi:Protein of unknown function (DUF565)
MQNTRLSTLVESWLEQFNRWLRNPWRRISLVLISLLGGNFLATTVSTISGQKADWDVFVSALLVVLAEGISWLMYRRPQNDRSPRGENSIFLEMLNGIKLGLTYGLFVEAFKLGS